MFGPNHPEVARALTNLGNVQRNRGDLAAAEANQTRALIILEEALGPDHPGVAITLTGPVANSGVGRRMGRGGPRFRVC